MLGSLLKGILFEPSLSLRKSRIDFFELVAGVVDVLSKHDVFFLELFIVIPLFWV